MSAAEVIEAEVLRLLGEIDRGLSVASLNDMRPEALERIARLLQWFLLTVRAEQTRREPAPSRALRPWHYADAHNQPKEKRR